MIRRRRWSRRCYEAALRALWAANDAGLDPHLVHGMTRGISGIAHVHDHAWVEVGAYVIDLTQGEAPIPRADFYAANQIDAASVSRYAAPEASRLVISRNSCGPWPDATPPAAPSQTQTQTQNPNT